jgi:ATP-dependent protease HslVU (ClpYQ) peptidase subunit
MTCIAGIASNGKAVIGGDSAGTNSHGELQLRRDSKVFRCGKHLLIGLSGDPVASQKIRFADILESWVSDAEKTMVKVVVPAFEYHLKGLKFDMLVGIGGRLFHVYDNFQLTEEQASYDAAGSGSQVARGSLYSTDHEPHVSPEVRIKLALQAAERFCSGVRGPFTILEI